MDTLKWYTEGGLLSTARGDVREAL